MSILIYNGDVDTICQFLGDEWFMERFVKLQKLKVRQFCLIYKCFNHAVYIHSQGYLGTGRAQRVVVPKWSAVQAGGWRIRETVGRKLGTTNCESQFFVIKSYPEFELLSVTKTNILGFWSLCADWSARLRAANDHELYNSPDKLLHPIKGNIQMIKIGNSHNV